MEIISWWRLARFALLLLGTSSWVAATQADTLPQVITETGPSYRTYPITSIPAIGPAGSKVTDPTFGTTVLRLTDGADGSTRCYNQYSYWPIFNKDSTRIAVLCKIGGQNRMELFDFNPTTFTASNRRLWAQTSFSDDYVWSGTDPNSFFFRKFATPSAIHSYNVATGVTTLVRDFTPEYGTDIPTQLSRSLDDDVFAFSRRTSSYGIIGYAVWKRSTNTFLLQQTDSNADEVQIDKSGRYLTVSRGDSQIWDLQASGGPRMTQLSYAVDGFWHYDSGYGNLVTNGRSVTGGGAFRQLNAPHTVTLTVPWTSVNGSQQNNHFSMLADDEGWALMINEGLDTPSFPSQITLPLLYEIYQVKTDGSGQVRRLVHHNSSVLDYSRNAFGNISRDGKFIAWTSDWGNPTGRTDIYLAQIPPTSGGSTPPPVPP